MKKFEDFFNSHPLPWAVDYVGNAGQRVLLTPKIVDAAGGNPLKSCTGTAMIVALANRLGDIERRLIALETKNKEKTDGENQTG